MSFIFDWLEYQMMILFVLLYNTVNVLLAYQAVHGILLVYDFKCLLDYYGVIGAQW